MNADKYTLTCGVRRTFLRKNKFSHVRICIWRLINLIFVNLYSSLFFSIKFTFKRVHDLQWHFLSENMSRRKGNSDLAIDIIAAVDLTSKKKILITPGRECQSREEKEKYDSWVSVPVRSSSIRARGARSRSVLPIRSVSAVNGQKFCRS